MDNSQEKSYYSSLPPPISSDVTACCTCATLLSNTAPRISSTSEKPVSDRTLDCCSRIICGDCIDKTPRFLTYCPYCQTSGRISSSASSSSASRSRLTSPPPYSPPPSVTTSPPPYTLSSAAPPIQDLKSSSSSSSSSCESIVHFLLPTDSISSLSLLYNIPPPLLRKHNNLPSDHLLFARSTILIPPGYGTQTSHSPQPIESEAELLRKTKIRKFMVKCKESDYDVAVTYLQGSGYDLEEACSRYHEDEEWEKGNPLEGKKKKKLSKENGGEKVKGGWFFGLG
ncbi:thiamine biosynthetic bifunctional enzyme [Cladorrhinum sp. PSN259]|nr:thiamine biosynthetic bifunctional enzyme [Cladorrhinum sp. PSN259]